MARPATLRSNRGTLSPARHRRSNGIRGIEGYGASTIIRKTHMLRFSPDAPILVQIVDTAENGSIRRKPQHVSLTDYGARTVAFYTANTVAPAMSSWRQRSTIAS